MSTHTLRHVLSLLTVAVVAVTRTDAQVSDPQEAVGRFSYDFFGGATHGIPSARALVAVPGQIADTGSRNALPTFGSSFNVWFTPVIGAYVDFGLVDLMKATARIGNISAESSGNLADFHSGIQVQYPGRRWRPYATFGAGVARISGEVSQTFGNASQRASLSTTAGSYAYGGGVRTMFTDHWGMRFGYEGVRLNSSGGSANYGRFLVGVLWHSTGR